MVFLMGLSVAKEPIRDVICRGRTCQNVCVCVCARVRCVGTLPEGSTSDSLL